MQSISFSQAEIQATREYWTAERMANATPAPLLGMKMPEGRQQKYDAVSKAETEMCFCASGEPIPEFIANVEDNPFSRAGRLYYLTAFYQPLYATAQFVGASNILMTAAHCLKNEFSGRTNLGWSTNILFQQAYKVGQSALNTGIVVGSAYVPPEWGFGNGFHMVKWDYGFMKTVDNSQSGFLNFSGTLRKPPEMTAIGYPENYGNEHRFMYRMPGRKGAKKDGAIPLRGNDMNTGSSGGAWFSASAYHNSNIIYGINSWHDSSKGTMWGPSFTPSVVSAMNDLKNGVQNNSNPVVSSQSYNTIA